VLYCTDLLQVARLQSSRGEAKPVVWRWQARFVAEGVTGLTGDKTRTPGTPPLPAATVQRVAFRRRNQLPL
jgi:hypothetical protein